MVITTEPIEIDRAMPAYLSDELYSALGDVRADIEMERFLDGLKLLAVRRGERANRTEHEMQTFTYKGKRRNVVYDYSIGPDGRVNLENLNVTMWYPRKIYSIKAGRGSRPETQYWSFEMVRRDFDQEEELQLILRNEGVKE